MHNDVSPELAELGVLLRRLRALGDQPTLAAISRRTPSHVSVSTLSRLFSGKTVPTKPVLDQVVSVLVQHHLTSRSAAQSAAEYDDSTSQLLQQIDVQWTRARQTQGSPRAVHTRGDQQIVAPQTEHVWVLQKELRMLMESAGLSIRLVATRTGIPRSTVSDVLSHPRPPRPDIVAGIAQACGSDDPQSWHRLAEQISRTSKPRDTQEGAGSSVEPDLSGSLIQAAVERPADEIAELAINFKESGQEDLAARLIEAAVLKCSAQEITAITLALLNHSPSRKEGTSEALAPLPTMPSYPPRSSAPLPEVPAPYRAEGFGPPPQMPAPRREPRRFSRLLRALSHPAP